MDDARREYRIARELNLDALRVNQRDAQTLARTAVFEARLGMHGEAATHISQAQALAPGDVEIQYRRAVVEALLGRTEVALQELSRAIRLGYSAKVAAEDDALVSLRSSERFRALVNRH